MQHGIGPREGGRGKEGPQKEDLTLFLWGRKEVKEVQLGKCVGAEAGNGGRSHLIFLVS